MYNFLSDYKEQYVLIVDVLGKREDYKSKGLSTRRWDLWTLGTLLQSVSCHKRDYFKMRLKFLKCLLALGVLSVPSFRHRGGWARAWVPEVASACEDGPAHVFQEEISWRRCCGPTESLRSGSEAWRVLYVLCFSFPSVTFYCGEIPARAESRECVWAPRVIVPTSHCSPRPVHMACLRFWSKFHPCPVCKQFIMSL